MYSATTAGGIPAGSPACAPSTPTATSMMAQSPPRIRPAVLLIMVFLFFLSALRPHRLQPRPRLAGRLRGGEFRTQNKDLASHGVIVQLPMDVAPEMKLIKTGVGDVEAKRHVVVRLHPHPDGIEGIDKG